MALKPHPVLLLRRDGWFQWLTNGKNVPVTTSEMAEKCKRRKRECNDLGLLSELNLEWLLKGASLLCFLKEPVSSFSFPQALSLFNSNLNTDLFSQHFSHTQYACVCGCLCACVCVRPCVGVFFFIANRPWPKVRHCIGVPLLVLVVWLLLLSSKQFSSVQGGIYALGKAHVRSTASLRSFHNVAFQTVQNIKTYFATGYIQKDQTRNVKRRILLSISHGWFRAVVRQTSHLFNDASACRQRSGVKHQSGRSMQQTCCSTWLCFTHITFR